MERESVLRTCRETTLLLEEIQRVLVPSAIPHSRAAAAFRELLRKRGKMADKLPEGWVDGGLEQLACAEILQEPSRIVDFLNAHGNGLSTEAAAFLRRLSEKPAFYAAFSMRERLDETLFTVSLASDGREETLHSPAMEELCKTGSMSYASLLVPNGACLQAVGLVHYYRGLSCPDFHFFARMLRPQEYGIGGLAAVMRSRPEQFLMLDFVTEVPPIGHEGQILSSHSSVVAVGEFDPARYADSFDVEEKGGVTRLRLKGSEPPLSVADLYYDRAKNLLAAYAQRKGDYARMALAVADQAALPPEPEWTASKNMETAVQMLLGRTMPALEYEKLFAGPAGTPAQKEELAKINSFLQDVVKRLNEGSEYSVDDLAGIHGLEPETATEVEASIRKSFDRFHIDVEGGLAGIPPVSPEEVRKLAASLKGNPWFRFRDTEEARGLFGVVSRRVEELLAEATGKRRPVSLGSLPKALEELDYSYWRQERCLILKYTLFLLCHKGGEFEAVGDYAAEVLKKFWQVLLESKARMQVRRFVKVYGIYCREALGRAGLVEIQEEEPQSDTRFRMKSSAFLAAWLAPSGYWRE